MNKHDASFLSDADHIGHIVLGHLALKANDVEKAKQHLLLAGDVQGSPVLGSFGPGMLLAKQLLEKGERDTVIKYLDECAKFWKHDKGSLETWIGEVKAGNMPDFGTSLHLSLNTWRVVP